MSQLAEIKHAAPQMIRYDAACRALAEAKAVDEVQDIRSKADAMRIYGMQAKNKTLEVDAAEIRIRAERKLGELIDQQKQTDGLNRGGRPSDKTGAKLEPVIPTLAQAGIDKKLSSRAQKLAAVPAEEFEAEVSDWRERVEAEGERVTTRLEKAGERAQSKTPAPTIESLQAENATLREELHEARHVASDFAKEIESFESASGDVKAAAKELTALKGQLETVSSQRDQWMTTCSELRKEVTGLRKKLERMEKAK